MKYWFEEQFPYALSALLVLIVFYGIYFVKMFIQKKHGIKTHQIGSRKEKGIHTVEILMSVATFGIVPVQLLSVISGWSMLPYGARFTGFSVGILGDIIFLLSVIYMRDNWRAGIPDKDKTSLVTNGIYKYSRNPAFLGFDLMYTGFLLIYFNPLTAVFTLFAAVMLHLQILQEEKYLSAAFGSEYAAYRKHVFRYLGRK